MKIKLIGHTAGHKETINCIDYEDGWFTASFVNNITGDEVDRGPFNGLSKMWDIMRGIEYYGQWELWENGKLADADDWFGTLKEVTDIYLEQCHQSGFTPKPEEYEFRPVFMDEDDKEIPIGEAVRLLINFASHHVKPNNAKIEQAIAIVDNYAFNEGW